jgi:hypothetical protein
VESKALLTNFASRKALDSLLLAICVFCFSVKAEIDREIGEPQFFRPHYVRSATAQAKAESRLRPQTFLLRRTIEFVFLVVEERNEQFVRNGKTVRLHARVSLTASRSNVRKKPRTYQLPWCRLAT